MSSSSFSPPLRCDLAKHPPLSLFFLLDFVHREGDWFSVEHDCPAVGVLPCNQRKHGSNEWPCQGRTEWRRGLTAGSPAEAENALRAARPPWTGSESSCSFRHQPPQKAHALLPPHPEDDFSRHQTPKQLAEAAGQTQDQNSTRAGGFPTPTRPPTRTFVMHG